jgi:hypothetical protein
VSGYLKLRSIRADRDRSLPERGVIRAEVGERRGRDGRLVYREAGYDPYADVARELVVDLETGFVIEDKVESMKAKYIREGRYKPKT